MRSDVSGLLASLCVALLMNAAVVGARLTSTPANVAVIAGDSTNFSCTTNTTATISWFRVNPTASNSDQVALFTGTIRASNYVSTRYNIVLDANKRQSTLTIVKVARIDAGTFACQEGSGDIASAELVVVDQVPSCDSAMPSSGIPAFTGVKMQCNMTYAGSAGPVLKWGYSETDSVAWPDVETAVPDTVNAGPDNATVANARLDVVATQVKHGRRYMCRTRFVTAPRRKKDIGTAATNIPTFATKCSASALNVLYCPRAMVISPSSAVYTAPATITCSASSNPPAVFTWKNLSTGKTFSAATLNITSADANGTTQRFMCSASNVIYGETCSNSVTITFRVDPAHGL